MCWSGIDEDNSSFWGLLAGRSGTYGVPVNGGQFVENKI